MANPSKLTPEILVPRLGDHLVQKGEISETQLKKALAYQQEKVSKGESMLIGQALVELNLLDRDRLDAAVTEQIIQLRSALQDANRNLERRVQERTAELQEALERLSDLSQLKANFVSNVSHELRTPLTHIKGYLELLTSTTLGSLTDEQKHALKVSQKSAEKLEHLIEDLIMFSLSTRGEFTIQLTPVDLQTLVKHTMQASKDKADHRGVSVHMVVDQDLPPVQADSQKIAWALGQLLDNAIKFTPKGGSAGINIKCENSRLVTISIVDNGIGIPEDRLSEIFEPFHQLDSSATRRYGGTGLGLSLVQQIIEAHGSRLDVKSTVGKGSVFSFALLAVSSSGPSL